MSPFGVLGTHLPATISLWCLTTENTPLPQQLPQNHDLNWTITIFTVLSFTTRSVNYFSNTAINFVVGCTQNSFLMWKIWQHYMLSTVVHDSTNEFLQLYVSWERQCFLELWFIYYLDNLKILNCLNQSIK